jgi:hypothetical protein
MTEWLIVSSYDSAAPKGLHLKKREKISKKAVVIYSKVSLPWWNDTLSNTESMQYRMR